MNQYLSFFPRIDDNTNYFLLKTYNGKYYQTFLDNDHVSLYSLEIYSQDNGALIINNKNKTKEFIAFSKIMKKGDIVLIPNMRNLYLSIGMIMSDHYLENNQVYRKVKWLKTISVEELWEIHRFLHLTSLLICINELKDDINRRMYKYFIKQNSYHVILDIKQQDRIMCKSIYGLYDIFLSQIDKEKLNITMKVQSPGIVELISDNLEVILIIIKIIKIIKMLTKKEKVDASGIVEKYFQYEVNKLQLELPDFDIETHNTNSL